MTALPHLVQEVTGVAFEFAQRMDVCTNVEHVGITCTKYAFNLMLPALRHRVEFNFSQNARIPDSVTISFIGSLGLASKPSA